MATKELPSGQFSAAQLARDNGIDPRFARARLRKGSKVPPVVKDKAPHVYNEAWVFENRYKDRVLKIIQGVGTTKKAKVEKEAEEAAEDIASADVEDNEDEELETEEEEESED